ncbi:hypothetical protein GKG47_11690 [Lactonifactor sp. BIOML-A3]|uniref:CHC2 zinc finger domain-containing protein n=1 Tax=unclassified Lactonifactor TaxID=2636670 RepID=UPI0012B0AAAE|nr:MULTISPECIES: CHC2 zinc finger domain-containing protein [unclassified Lactonifactor]MSA01074.1 hypothetical protein [Lactonifactor sp. BIOML-A5]MSA09873.1 hypothetical protein [Lactonifactor sp. BIOML-A4]MSA13091.1 hypothetical protein [Lactonifactor sp. BIOML-A3]MSA18627.1 hypothetical protein [Lactonifactor sp. BIOML-A2]MSA38330.1 hypothetical protein [Lactonifactor sp. BIOML-A1]
MLRDDDIELVKSQVNMRMLAEHFGIRVYRNGLALCPFHNDRNPSMKVHSGYLEHDGYYCWACGAGGTIFNFVMDYCNLDFEAAVKYIAGAFGVRITGEQELSQEEKVKIFHQKRRRELEVELRTLSIQALSLLSKKIRLYERLQHCVEPFGELFCWISNQLPLLQGQWEELFEELYSKKGVGRIG